MALFNPNDARLKKPVGAGLGLSQFDAPLTNPHVAQPYAGSVHLTEAPARFEVSQPQVSHYGSPYENGSAQGHGQRHAPQGQSSFHTSYVNGYQGGLSPEKPSQPTVGQSPVYAPEYSQSMHGKAQQFNGHSGYPDRSPQTQQAIYHAQGPAAMRPSHAYIGVPVGGRQSGWSTGAFDCLNFCDGTCVMTYFCPCVTYGQNYARVSGDPGSCASQAILYAILSICGPGLTAVVLGSPNRSRLRQKYNLAEDPCNDCLLHWCFGPIALCQEARELDIREATIFLHHGGSYAAPQQQTMAV